MNKIIFVQRESEDRLGVMILTAYLKANGIDAEIIIDPYKRINVIKQLKPDFIGISLLSPSVDWTLSTCRFLKKHLPGVVTVLGGPHPTFFPNVVEQDGVDIVCVGEGEKPLLQMLQSYDGTFASIENTPNLWIKKNNTIKKKTLIPLLTKDELSELPFCDRRHYSQHPRLRNTPHRRVWTSRGCPYSCSYCFNSNYKEIYKGLGVMVRQRSVDSVINELKQLKTIGVEVLDFVDDHFLLSKKWIQDFCEQYRKHVGLPFVCNTTAQHIDTDMVIALKSAGCRSLNFAIESGVESIRKNIYNKNITDEHIYTAAEVLNTHGLPFLTYNMLGLPEETLEDMYRTVKINQQINTTYPWCSILQPYPGTEIAEHVMKSEGELSAQVFTYSYFQSSVIGEPKRRKMIRNAVKLFAHCVNGNVSYDEFVRMVQDVSIKSYLYPFIFYYHYGTGIKSRYGYSWHELFKFWLYSRSSTN